MDRIERVRAKIRDIAQRRRNVTINEIEWVVNQLEAQGFRVRSRTVRHGTLYTVEGRTFMVNSHNPGNSQVKAYSVDHFVDVMTELGLCED